MPISLIDGVATGPRNYRWRPTEPATLTVEALDGGDPKKKVPHRDRVLMLKAPFNGAPTELYKTEHRFAGMHSVKRQVWRSSPITIAIDAGPARS